MVFSDLHCTQQIGRKPYADIWRGGEERDVTPTNQQ